MRYLIAMLLPVAQAMASCWVDNGVSNISQQLANRHFPVVARNLPQILVCTPEHFGINVAASYHSGSHQVFVHVNNINAPTLTTILVHELAHAAVSLSYGHRPEADGHGYEWMRMMIQAGYADEAQRVASTVPGAEAAFARASGRRENSLLAQAQAQAAEISCDALLMVPPQGGVIDYYVSGGVLQLRHLPSQSIRMIGIWRKNSSYLSVEVTDSSDGTSTLICLRNG